MVRATDSLFVLCFFFLSVFVHLQCNILEHLCYGPDESDINVGAQFVNKDTTTQCHNY